MISEARVIPLFPMRATTATDDDNEAIPENDPIAPRTSRRTLGLVALATLASFALATALTLLCHRHEVDELAALPPEPRAALFERTWADVARICTLPAASRDTLRAHCLEQARFLRLFEACTSSCQTLAQTILPHTR